MWMLHFVSVHWYRCHAKRDVIGLETYFKLAPTNKQEVYCLSQKCQYPWTQTLHTRSSTINLPKIDLDRDTDQLKQLVMHYWFLVSKHLNVNTRLGKAIGVINLQRGRCFHRSTRVSFTWNRKMMSFCKLWTLFMIVAVLLCFRTGWLTSCTTWY